MSEAERRGIWTMALILLALGGVRWVGAQSRPAPPPEPAGEAGAVRDSLLARAARALDEEARRSEPLAEGERLDPNRAPEAELDRLPGVGPALARAWVEDREARGEFRTALDLLRVKGLGEATLARVRPHLRFPVSTPEPGPVGTPRGGPGALRPHRLHRLDINRATAGELEALPGIGPALARRILEHRREHGPFPSVRALEEVRGIGPALRSRLDTLVTAGDA